MSTKTPVTVLQELMVKHGTIPLFEFLEADSSGAFQCRVKALDATAIGKGRSKKDAKHEAARIVLEKLAQVGKYFPNDSHDLTPSQQSSDCTDMLINHVGILKDLCFELHMSNPEYDCVGETGLAHSMQFTIKCTTGSIQRSATAASKKQAKQMAAEKIYNYLNENMQKRILEAAEQDNLELKESESPQSNSMEDRNDLRVRVASISSLTPGQPPCKKRKQSGPMVNSNELSSLTCQYLSESRRVEPDDNYLDLAKVWATKLKSLDFMQRKYAEKAFNDVLFEADLGTLHRNSVQINNGARNVDSIKSPVCDTDSTTSLKIEM